MARNYSANELKHQAAMRAHIAQRISQMEAFG